MFTIFTSDDVDSPVLSDVPGGLGRVLKAILTDGYTGHPAVGWTTHFEASGGPAGNSDPKTFRAPVGTRQWYRFADTFNFPNNNYSIWAAENQVDVTEVTMTNMWAGGANTGGRPDGAGAHKWIAFADNKTCYLFYEPVGGSGLYHVITFGDFWPYGPADVWNAFYASWNANPPLMPDTASEIPGLACVMRSYDGLLLGRGDSGGTPTGIRLNLHSDLVVALTNHDTTLSGKIAFPDPVSNKIWLAPIYVGGIPGSPYIRGKLRGLWLWLHPATAIADRDAFPGTGDFAGRTFMAIRNVRTATGSGPSVMIVETSNTVP